ncbi:hypothetical protein ACTU44_08760 [Thalassospira sp. SM2505]
MAFDVRIDIREAAALADAFDKSPKIVTEELTAATWQASLLLEREVKENTPTGVGGGGGLKGSISAREPEVLSDNVIGMVGTPLDYAVPVELGTRPHFPPVQPLADWAEHKLGLSPAEAQGAAFAIARKISRTGTKGAHMFERAFEDNDLQVQRIFDRARVRIADRMGGRA